MNFFKKEPNIKFLRMRYYAFALSGLIIVSGLLVYFKRGFNMGIDFTGGTLIEVAFKNSTHVTDVRAALRAVDMAGAQITSVGKENKFFIKTMTISGKKIAEEKMEDHEVIARRIKRALMNAQEQGWSDTGKFDLNNNAEGELGSFLRAQGINDEDARETASIIIGLRKGIAKGVIDDYADLEKTAIKKRILSMLKETTYFGSYSVLSVEIVGPQVGKDLRRKTTLACIWALIAMLIYIAFRFKFLYGISGLLTLFHDVLVSLSFVAMFRVEMSLQVVAAILTIVGYSINDTIVVFDRLRENLKILRKEKLEEILDKSLNQTLSRSIITSFTVFLTVLSLYLFGGEVIRPFAFTMLVGVIAGSYSTIFQSCAWLKVWEKSFMKRKNV